MIPVAIIIASEIMIINSFALDKNNQRNICAMGTKRMA
jgi:hypothetical protein